MKTNETILQHVKNSLALLQIRSIARKFTSYTLFFCGLYNGLTFDIEIGSDGTVTLWRLIPGTIKRRWSAYDKAGEVGIRISSDGFSTIYAKKTYLGRQSDGFQILRQIMLYTLCISYIQELCDCEQDVALCDDLGRMGLPKGLLTDIE